MINQDGRMQRVERNRIRGKLIVKTILHPYRYCWIYIDTFLIPRETKVKAIWVIDTWAILIRAFK